MDAYRPTELVGLQYHLHIPGPDPLTNPDSISRSQYYGVRGTPSIYFNGKAAAAGGGPRAAAQGKCDAYLEVVQEGLAGQRDATINLKVSRENNTVRIDVAAVAKPAANRTAANNPPATSATGDASGSATSTGSDDKKAGDGDDDKQPEPQLRLRLALVQDVVRYAGGNKLRFHHHVVRGMPGGPQGKELVDGRCAAQFSVDLDETRAELDQYLKEFAAEAAFPEPLPPFELTGLSVVALVQDDANKRVLDAVLAAVAEPK